MTQDNPPPDVSRRLLLGGVGAALLAVFGTGAYQVSRMFRSRRRPSQYDDLIGMVREFDGARRVGKEVLSESQLAAWEIAPHLRKHIGGRPLADVVASDARDGRLVETAGWVMPETLALLCTLYVEIGA